MLPGPSLSLAEGRSTWSGSIPSFLHTHACAKSPHEEHARTRDAGKSQITRADVPVQALKLGNPLALGYSGPNLRRPIASNEIMLLARLLVRASDAANAALGLEQPPTEAEQQSTDTLQVFAWYFEMSLSLEPLLPNALLRRPVIACISCTTLPQVLKVSDGTSPLLRQHLCDV